jgi:ketosteroid isomerase-like protein
MLGPDSEGNAMTEVLRQRIYSMCSAYARGKLDFVLNSIDDDVDFVSYAPITIFPCLGRQRGKAAVERSIETIHAHYEFLSYLPIFMVVEENDAAVIVMARMKQRATERIIQTLFAQFVRFRDGRIVEFREFLDSFDAVEQVLGREIEIKPNKN